MSNSKTRSACRIFVCTSNSFSKACAASRAPTPSPTTQAEWASRADNFSRTLEEAKKAGKDTLESTEEDSILADIGKGLALLVLAPLGALFAAVVFASGSILFGTGKLIVGIGHAMTFGKLK